jgi:hypothetical protein
MHSEQPHERLTSPSTIRLSLSSAFIDKAPAPSLETRYCKKHGQPDTCWAFGFSFRPATISLEGFADHIRAGRAWTLHAFTRDRRISSHWQSSQLLALDLDKCALTAPELASVPFIRDHAYLIYPTPSNTQEQPKNRVVFVLDEPITHAGSWKAMQIALMSHLAELQPDPACKDTARLFYGSTQGGMIVLGNTLPAATAGGLTKTLAETDEQVRLLRKQQPPRAIQKGSSTAQRIAYLRLNRTLDELSACTDDRHNALIKAAGYLFGLVKGDWPLTDVEVERGLMDACSRNGYVLKVSESEVQRCIDDMRRSAAAVPLEIQPRPPSRPIRDAQLPQIDRADVEALTPLYVSHDLTPSIISGCKTLLVAAPVGMGKTRAVADYANTLPDWQALTALAQFRLLTMALYEALADSLHYEDEQVSEHVTRLVTSISSLAKFLRSGGVVIADEIEGILQFLTHSGTFKAGGAIEAYSAFKTLVARADQFIGMDAGLSDITVNWIRAHRGNITVKHYRRQDSQRKVSFLRDRYAAIHQIGKMLKRGRGAVYVACSSETTASDIVDHYSDKGWRILKITRDTSSTPVVEAFIKNRQNERSNYDLVVYTSAMGAGVDISDPVYALVGIFDRNPLAPEQALQLFGRVRNAQRYYAAAPPVNEGYRTSSADELLADKIKRECWTAQQRGGQPNISGLYLELLHLWSQFEARKLKESSQWRSFFAARLKQSGFAVAANNARAPQPFIDDWKVWKEQRDDENWQYIYEAEGSARSDDELNALRIAGVEISHELKLQNVRYKIERALGHENFTQDDRDLVSQHGRRRHFRLVDLFTDPGDLISSDRAQSSEGKPLQKRSYRTLNQRIVSTLLNMAGFTGPTIEAQFLEFADYFRAERPAAEISERFEVYTSQKALSKFQAIGHHGNNARTAPGLCRWLLEYFGLKLESFRRGRAEGRYMAYQINVETLEHRLERARRAALERTKNVKDKGKHIFGTHHTASLKAATYSHSQNIKAANPFIDDLLRSGRPVNPFAGGGGAS